MSKQETREASSLLRITVINKAGASSGRGYTEERGMATRGERSPLHPWILLRNMHRMHIHIYLHTHAANIPRCIRSRVFHVNAPPPPSPLVSLILAVYTRTRVFTRCHYSSARAGNSVSNDRRVVRRCFTNSGTHRRRSTDSCARDKDWFLTVAEFITPIEQRFRVDDFSPRRATSGGKERVRILPSRWNTL